MKKTLKDFKDWKDNYYFLTWYLDGERAIKERDVSKFLDELDNWIIKLGEKS